MMNNPSTYEKDLADIRLLMERSSRFISLSGMAGVMAGIYALAGALGAYYILYYPNSPFGFRFYYVNETRALTQLSAIALGVLVAAILTAWALTTRKAKRLNLRIWNASTRNLLLHLGIPLAAGGAFILIMLYRNYLGLVAPGCLLFYGMSLLNASHFTYGDIRWLGVGQMATGLACAAFPGYGLLFWAFGFGLLHMGYGLFMHYKYDR
jgi:hypothetical protein